MLRYALLQVVAQLLRARGVTQLAQGLRFDLADALAGYVELAAYFLEGAAAAIFEAEAQLQHFALARRQAGEHVHDLLLEQLVGGSVGRGQGHRVLDEVTEVGVFLLADRGLQRDRLLRDLHDLAYLLRRNLHATADLFRGRFTAVLLHQAPADTDELVNGLDHVYRDSDGAGLVGDGARDRLADPP